MKQRISDYFSTLDGLQRNARVSDAAGRPLALEAFFAHGTQMARNAHAQGRKLMFVGNGGSATIASHMATDFSKNGGMRSMAFNDGALLTCLGNDYGYEHVFAKQIEFYAQPGDVLAAISSSGKSANILNAVKAARAKGCAVITLSGFDANNPLRQTGDINVYVASHEYGFVEVAHLALWHALLDLAMGWGEQAEPTAVPA